MPPTSRSVANQFNRGLTPAVAVVMAGGLGVLSVLVISSNSDLEVKAPAVPSDPVIATDLAATSGDEAVDPRIALVDLPGSTLAPLVADDSAVWVAVVEDASSGASGLYRYEPAAGVAPVRVTGFAGSPTALALAGEEIAIGAGNVVYLVHTSTGTIRSIVLEERPGPAEGTVLHVSALASVGERLFAATAGSSLIDEIDLTTGARGRQFSVAGRMAPPASLLKLDDDTLVASTPFGEAGGSGPGSVAIDLKSGALTTLDLGRPFGFAQNAAGEWVTTQSVPGGGVTRVSRGVGADLVQKAEVASKIPWDGRWDLLAVGPDGSIWGVTLASDLLFHESPDGSLDTYSLPVRRIVPSIPNGVNLTPEELESMSNLVRRPNSMVTLGDGSLVFLIVNGGNSLGYIKGP